MPNIILSKVENEPNLEDQEHSEANGSEKYSLEYIKGQKEELDESIAKLENSINRLKNESSE